MTSASDRPTLTIAGLRRAAVDLPWGPLEVVAATGSTNADAAARAGAAEGLVIAADEQTAGRGRLGRTWVSPPGASVSVSVLLRPHLKPQQWGWLPLLTGLAVADGVTAATGVPTVLKWPNDVLVEQGRPGKIAGVLVERAGDAAVAGFGINTAMTADELPVAAASSLSLAGAAASDPDALVAACLRHLHRHYAALLAADGDAGRSGVAQQYRERCSTLGREVSVALPGGDRLQGGATGIDDLGRLLVASQTGTVAVAAGDVVHVR